MNEKKAQQTMDKVKESYAIIGEEFSQTRQKPGTEFIQILPYIKGAVADIGCGNGRLGRFLLERKIGLPPFTYVGIDNSEKMVEIARKENPQLQFQLGDFINLPCKDQSLNTIVSLRAFHHLPSKKTRHKALQEMHRTLSEDGTLILTVWNMYEQPQRKHLNKARLRSLASLGTKSPHDTLVPWGKKTVRYYHAFSPTRLKKLVESNGFTVQDIQVGPDLLLIAKKNSEA